MTTAILVGALCALAALLMARPLWSSPRSRTVSVTGPDPDEERRTELMRQLRDLDEDLAAGKLPIEDHERLRGPLAREAAAVLGTLGARSTGQVAATAPSDPAGSARSPRRPRKVLRWTVALALVAAGAAGVSRLLMDEAQPRQAVAAPVEPAGAPDAAPASGATVPSAQQIADVEAAVARVTDSPKSVPAHLALAEAYAVAGQSQLSTIEYLAVLRLQPNNPVANTELAFLAFQGGDVTQARDMVERVLDAHPDYPEALYARGVIAMMGLNQPERARTSLEAYLAAAPFGSHRKAADDLLEIIDGQAKP